MHPSGVLLLKKTTLRLSCPLIAITSRKTYVQCPLDSIRSGATYETNNRLISLSSSFGRSSKKVALAGNRTRASRVAGENSTTEPPVPC